MKKIFKFKIKSLLIKEYVSLLLFSVVVTYLAYLKFWNLNKVFLSGSSLVLLFIFKYFYNIDFINSIEDLKFILTIMPIKIYNNDIINKNSDSSARSTCAMDQPLAALNTLFITGFTDAEGTFTISITKDNRKRKTTRRLLNNIDRNFFSSSVIFYISK